MEIKTKFIPVVVNKGRKFRGEAYDIGSEVKESSFQLAGWRGRGGWVSSQSVKLWSPTKGFVWANPNYVEIVEGAAAEKIHADYDKYVTAVFDDTVSRVSKDKRESEVTRFARNVIRKHHPGLLELFDDKYHTNEDIVSTVNSTLDWAFKLGYSNAKSVRIALRACIKRNLVKHEAFIPAWTIYLDLRGLGHLVKKYLPEDLQAQCIQD